MRSTFSFFAATLFLNAVAAGQQYVISTFAGGGPPLSAVPALSISLGTVWGVATDSVGNIYLSSSDLNSVFRLDSAGQLTLVAGNGRGGYSGDGALAVAAQLNAPRGLAADTAGNVFVADMGNGRVRKVSPSGVITTVPGSTDLQSPFAVAVDGSGNLFVAELDGNRIRRISTSGDTNSVAGTGTQGFSGDGGPATAAQMNAPTGVAVDAAGDLFIADYGNGRVRRISLDGTIMTVAGGGNSRQEGVLATDTHLLAALGVALDSQGSLYIAEEYGGIQKVSPDGTITTVAGGGNNWNIVDGVTANTVAIEPIAVAVDFAGDLSIADGLFYTRVRRVSASGILTTVAGNGQYCCFSGDGGPAASAQLLDPSSVTTDAGGNVYIADAKNSRIRKVSPDGTITTVASACYWPDDIWAPCGVAVDATGNLYTSDDSGVFRIPPDGSKTNLADFGIGLVVDSAGNLFIADQYHGVVRKLSPDGTTSTVAGNGTIGFSGDGGPATAAQLSLLTALAIDRSGNLYIADSGNRRIRMVSAAGVIDTVVDATADFDGTWAAIGLNNLITGLAVDDSGHIFIEELSPLFQRIRRASPDGTITTIAGAGPPGYSGDGGPAVRAQINPSADEIGNSLALDASGSLYVVDGANNAVRILRPVGQITRTRRD
jgi:sugar lactone lactonase YvrE